MNTPEQENQEIRERAQANSNALWARTRRERRLAGKFGRIGNVIVREEFLKLRPDLVGKGEFNPNHFNH